MKLTIKAKFMKAKASKFPLNEMGLIPVIPLTAIEREFGAKEYAKFMKYMYGQTISVDGVYPDDVERYIKNSKYFD